MKRSKKSKNCLILFIFLSIITVGYAVLSAAFNISGIASITSSTWSLYFDNLEVTEGSVPIREGGRTPTIPAGSKNTTLLEWDVNLKKPGDFYEFTVDIVNDGSIDAAIQEITITPTLTEDEEKIISYGLTYVINDSALEVNDGLSSGERLKVRMRVVFKKDINAADLDFLEDDGIEKTITMEINYIQADGSQNKVTFLKGGARDLVRKANSLTVSNYKSGNTSEMYAFEQPATSQLDATIDYRFIGDTHCSYDRGAYWFVQRDGGTCSVKYKKNSSGTITYEDSCVEDGGTTCEELTGELKEIHNYIKFNGNETWRIIGVFGGNIKIIKDESVATTHWDYKNNVGSSTLDSGSNDWTDSQLMYYLNQGNYGKSTYTKVGNLIYDDSSPKNLLYEIGKLPVLVSSSTDVYNGVDGTWSLDSTALKQVEVTKFYLGAHGDSDGGTTLSRYTTERGENKSSSARTLFWEGKVGLMYPSDYGFTFGKGVSDSCYSELYSCSGVSSWLSKDSTYQWMLSPYSGNETSTFCILNTGGVSAWGASNVFTVSPVVYLKSNIKLTGSGTKTNPYTIVS